MWRYEYAHLTIRRPTADICDDCYLFYNRVKYKSEAVVLPIIMLKSDDDDSVVQQEDDGFIIQTTLTEEDSMELMIEKAALHI
jgi:hypothetical protein